MPSVEIKKGSSQVNQQLPPGNRGFETLTVAQLAKKYPTIYGTRRFITMTTKIRGLVESNPHLRNTRDI